MMAVIRGLITVDLVLRSREIDCQN